MTTVELQLGEFIVQIAIANIPKLVEWLCGMGKPGQAAAQSVVAQLADAKAVDGMTTEYLLNQDSMEAMSRGINAKFVSVLQPYLHLRRKTTASENSLLAQRIYGYRQEAMTTAFRRLDLELARHRRGPGTRLLLRTHRDQGRPQQPGRHDDRPREQQLGGPGGRPGERDHGRG